MIGLFIILLPLAAFVAVCVLEERTLDDDADQMDADSAFDMEYRINHHLY